MLGNLTFSEVNSQTQVSREVDEVASLLAVNSNELSNILCRGDKLQEYFGIFMVPSFSVFLFWLYWLINEFQAHINRDTIAKCLYCKLVLELIVDRINDKLKSSKIQADKLQTLSVSKKINAGSLY
jgi:myosin heavy subunit